MSDDAPLGFRASDISPRTGSAYPAEFAGRVAGREKRVLGNPFGLTNFGVNCTTLKPGAESALMHRHKTQDEFVYILEGTATLVTDRGEMDLSPGMCAGFPKGGLAHHLVNRPGSATLIPYAWRERTWSIWKSATARPATRAAIRPTT